MESNRVVLTKRLKIKASAHTWLRHAAMDVNTVWNFCNQASLDASDKCRRIKTTKSLSGFDLVNLTSGSSKYTDFIGSSSIQRVCTEFASNRIQAKKRFLKWRKSLGPKRSLGWIPFKSADIKRIKSGVRFCKKSIRLFNDDALDDLKWCDGCFAEDACGDWWLCLPIKIPVETREPTNKVVGIDLGLKDTATTSDGEKLAAGRYFRDLEPKIAQAQKRGHKKQAKLLHRKAKNKRKIHFINFQRNLLKNMMKYTSET